MRSREKPRKAEPSEDTLLFCLPLARRGNWGNWGGNWEGQLGHPAFLLASGGNWGRGNWGHPAFLLASGGGQLGQRGHPIFLLAPDQKS